MVGKKQSSRSNKSKKTATTKKPRPARKQAKPKTSVKSSKKMKSSKNIKSSKPKVISKVPKKTAVKKPIKKSSQKNIYSKSKLQNKKAKKITNSIKTKAAKKEDNLFAEQEKLLSELALEMPEPPSPSKSSNSNNVGLDNLNIKSSSYVPISEQAFQKQKNPSFFKWLFSSKKQTIPLSSNSTKDELDMLEKSLLGKDANLKKTELKTKLKSSGKKVEIKSEAKSEVPKPVKAELQVPEKNKGEQKKEVKEIPLTNIPNKSSEKTRFFKWLFSSKKKAISKMQISPKDELDMLEKSMLNDNIKPKKLELKSEELPKLEKKVEIISEIKPKSSKSTISKPQLQQLNVNKLKKETKSQEISPLEPPEPVDGFEPKKHFDLFSFLKKKDKASAEIATVSQNAKPAEENSFALPPDFLPFSSPIQKPVITKKHEKPYVLKKKKEEEKKESIKIKEDPLANIPKKNSGDSGFFSWLFSSKEKPVSPASSSLKDELDMLEKSMLNDGIKPKKLELKESEEKIAEEKNEMPVAPVAKSEAPKELPKHILPREKRPKVDLFAIFKKETKETLKKEEKELSKEKQVAKPEHQKHLEKATKLHETLMEKRIALSQSIFELEKKKKQLESEIKEDEKHLRILDTQKRDKLQQIDERQRQLARKEIELADKGRLLEEKHNEHKDIHEAVQKKKEEHNLLEKQAKDYQKQVEKLDAQLKNLYSARDALKSENDSLKKNLGEKEKQLNEKESILSKKEKQLTEAAASLNKAEAELQKNKKIHLDMHELLNKKKVEVEMKAKVMGGFEKKRAAVQSEISKLRIEKEKLDIEILETNKFITDKESEKKQIQDSLEAVKKEKSSIEESINSSKKELDQLIKDIKSRKNELEKKNRELSKVQQKIDSKKTDAETKNILSMLDNLLGKLPDNVIDEFSKSEDFDKYEKVMGKLGLK